MSPAFFRASLNWVASLVHPVDPDGVPVLLARRVAELNSVLGELGFSTRLVAEGDQTRTNIFVIKDNLREPEAALYAKENDAGGRFSIFLRRGLAQQLLEPNDPRHHGAYMGNLSRFEVTHHLSLLMTIALTEEEKLALVKYTTKSKLPDRSP